MTYSTGLKIFQVIWSKTKDKNYAYSDKDTQDRKNYDRDLKAGTISPNVDDSSDEEMLVLV